MVLSDKSDSYLENFLANLRFYFLPGANFFFPVWIYLLPAFYLSWCTFGKKKLCFKQEFFGLKKFVVGIQLFGVVQKGDLSGI